MRSGLQLAVPDAPVGLKYDINMFRLLFRLCVFFVVAG